MAFSLLAAAVEVWAPGPAGFPLEDFMNRKGRQGGAGGLWFTSDFQCCCSMGVVGIMVGELITGIKGAKSA